MMQMSDVHLQIWNVLDCIVIVILGVKVILYKRFDLMIIINLYVLISAKKSIIPNQLEANQILCKSYLDHL